MRKGGGGKGRGRRFGGKKGRGGEGEVIFGCLIGLYPNNTHYIIISLDSLALLSLSLALSLSIYLSIRLPIYLHTQTLPEYMILIRLTHTPAQPSTFAASFNYSKPKYRLT